jgi:hypothetical protein
MAVPQVHPSRGTAGTARGARTVRSNEGLDACASARRLIGLARPNRQFAPLELTDGRAEE